jgi:hypothetical protein
MTSSQAQSAGGPGPMTDGNPSIVVRGGATPEQLAALVAVLSAASGGEAPASGEPRSTWAAHAAAMRHPVNHGPGAWRTSLRS